MMMKMKNSHKKKSKKIGNENKKGNKKTFHHIAKVAREGSRYRKNDKYTKKIITKKIRLSIILVLIYTKKNMFFFVSSTWYVDRAGRGAANLDFHFLKTCHTREIQSHPTNEENK